MRCSLLRISWTCKLFLFFCQISPGIKLLHCPCNVMVISGYCGLLINSSCVCHLDYIFENCHHPQTTSISIYVALLLPTLEKTSWLKNLVILHGFPNYAPSMVFMKHSPWWLSFITSYIHPNMPSSLSLYLLYHLHNRSCVSTSHNFKFLKLL